ncbi:MAG: ATP-binding protein [Pseudobdellovibrionaceae bacterium]
MLIKSFIQCENKIQPVDIEISLIPGLPQIHYLGLADQVIKESLLRIKSAMKNAGWIFPRTQQVVVNIQPVHLKKTSQGLDLAVVLGILHLTEQMPWQIDFSKTIVYGELALDGTIKAPPDIEQLVKPKGFELLTGGGATDIDHEFLLLSGLGPQNTIRRQSAVVSSITAQRPQFGLEKFFDPEHAELLKIAALSECSVLLAGPSGSGKTTWAHSLPSFLSTPDSVELKKIRQQLRTEPESFQFWRPLLQPHHSCSYTAILGGGHPPKPGDLFKAHHGVLLLDELLEFSSETLEALREPMESGHYRLVRNTQVSNYHIDVQVVATSNLCPCGDWTPKKISGCQKSLYLCRSYLNHLSGPLVDRFAVMLMTQDNHLKKANVSGASILEDLENVREWRKQQIPTQPLFAKKIKHWSRPELLNMCPDLYQKEIIPHWQGSQRRSLFTLRTARALADLDQSLLIQSYHIENALSWSWTPFMELKKHF